MDNNYFTQVAPYMQQLSPQDQAGLNPVFQNMAAQQANQNAALQQQMQNNQAAGQVQGGGGGMNPMAMAAMLRAKDGASSNLGARADMALNSQASPYLQNQVNQLGSSTSNPFSNYNMGTNGWGNYGE
jgi:hypothetical protein